MRNPPTDLGRLAAARARLAALGPRENDRTGDRMRLRWELEARVRDLELALGVQRELPLDPAVVDVDGDDTPLALFGPDELERQ